VNVTVTFVLFQPFPLARTSASVCSMVVSFMASVVVGEERRW